MLSHDEIAKLAEDRSRANGVPLSLVAIQKPLTNESYVFLYVDATRAQIMLKMGRFASNPDLSFSWSNAAFGSQKVREVENAEPDVFQEWMFGDRP